jgi:hypothetical protein
MLAEKVGELVHMGFMFLVVDFVNYWFLLTIRYRCCALKSIMMRLLIVRTQLTRNSVTCIQASVFEYE